jgi:AcrR family transcriptional regulator
MSIGTKHKPSSTRKQEIIDAATLVLRNEGVNKFTIEQVAEHAGIAKGTVYKHFTNKDQILSEVANTALNMLKIYFKRKIDDSSGTSIDTLNQMCIASYEYYLDHPNYFELISYIERPELNIPMTNYLKLIKDIQSLFTSIIEKGQATGEIKDDIDSLQLDYVFWACTVGLIQFIDAKHEILQMQDKRDVGMKLMSLFAESITNGIRI